MASDYRGKNKLHFGLRYALNGLKEAILTERNIKIHFIAALVVCVFGLFLPLSNVEWAILSLAIGAVISMEMMNTALERALDHLEPRHQTAIGIAKDIAAGAVFITALIAIVIACLIFLPKL
ncbi:diacylglycerol kinase family protein [Gracilibacillus massiliensis]|uniref:diacylglycerol kinase family protein n=1 Tax=Gracilibacillus massiliensis TaxID=1564956 RepID=UPI00071CF862|nr:diacylglycerol kinase family protein [Gracilibacillus massiliensis]